MIVWPGAVVGAFLLGFLIRDLIQPRRRVEVPPSTFMVAPALDFMWPEWPPRANAGANAGAAFVPRFSIDLAGNAAAQQPITTLPFPPANAGAANP